MVEYGDTLALGVQRQVDSLEFLELPSQSVSIDKTELQIQRHCPKNIWRAIKKDT